MFKLCFLFLTCMFVHTVYSAVAIQRPEKKPAEFENQDGCYNSNLNMVLPFNQRYSPSPNLTGCLQYLCQTDGDTQIFSCGKVEAGPGCELVDGDNDAPYPDCCQKFSCTPQTQPEDISENSE